MKRFLVLLLCLTILLSGVSAQTSIDDLTKALSDLSVAAAPAMLSNSTIGANWSDAWIGDLLAFPPHFGVGATLGATAIPATGIKPLLDAVNFTVPDMIASFGAPLPALVVNARAGGFLLPFDVGAKIGFLPAEALSAIAEAVPGLELDYLLVGADVRYALIKENLLFPSVSVGLAYNNLGMKMSMPVGTGLSYDINGKALVVSNPVLSMETQASSFDLTAQVSKSLLFFTPYLGAGCTLGVGETKTGILSTLSYDGQPLSEAQLTQLKADAALYNISIPSDIKSTGLSFTGNATGPAFRLFGGVSLNILVLKLDVSAFYNLAGGNYGAQLGTRIQL